MLKKILLFVIILIFFNLSADYYLISDSDKKILKNDDIKNKSMNFLIYAIDEIYARKGYIFKNNDLDLYFSNMKWYIKKTGNVKLSKIEQDNIDFINSFIEKKKKSFPNYPAQVYFHYLYNNRPLFYVALVTDRRFDKDLQEGKLVLLDKDNLWTLKCKTIPYEYLEDNKINDIHQIGDACFSYEDSTRIQIIDFNHDNIQDILTQMRPESGNEDGFFKIISLFENRLVLIFNKRGEFKKMKELSNNIIKIDLFQYADQFCSSTGFVNSFVLNMTENTIYQIPAHYKNVLTPYYCDYKCLREVPLYSDAISAMKKDEKAVINHTIIGKKYIFEALYFNPPIENVRASKSINQVKAIKLKMGNKSIGWINYYGKGSLYNNIFEFFPGCG